MLLPFQRCLQAPRTTPPSTFWARSINPFSQHLLGVTCVVFTGFELAVRFSLSCPPAPNFRFLGWIFPFVKRTYGSERSCASPPLRWSLERANDVSRCLLGERRRVGSATFLFLTESLPVQRLRSSFSLGHPWMVFFLLFRSGGLVGQGQPWDSMRWVSEERPKGLQLHECRSVGAEFPFFRP